MFRHDKRLQYDARPESPDPVYAKKLQELIGGPFGEITVMMQYLFQGWNCRGPDKYRDMLFDIGTEEIGHIEMLATMVARLLEGASTKDQEAAAKEGSVVGAVMGGTSPKDMIMATAMNPKHAITTGTGARPDDSVGYPWNGRYVATSGNLLADFRANLTAESQGRLQASRLYYMTADEGVRDMLSFLIARDSMHQHQWIAAIAELEADGLETSPVPSRFPQELEHHEASRQHWNLSEGGESGKGSWARGMGPRGEEIEYLTSPEPLGGSAVPPLPDDPRLFDTSVTPSQEERRAE